MSIMAELRAIKEGGEREVKALSSHYADLYFKRTAELLEGNKVRIVKKDQRGNVDYDKTVVVKDVFYYNSNSAFAIRPEHDHKLNIIINNYDELTIINE